MDRLPQEVVDRIVDILCPFLTGRIDAKYDRHLSKPRLSDTHGYGASTDWEGYCASTDSEWDAAFSYATISPTWKRSIERLTFRMLKVRSETDALLAEEALSRDPHRRESLRRIAWTIKSSKDFLISRYFPQIRDQLIVNEFRNILRFINRIRVSL